jgi:hypothetical protein
MCSPTNQQSTRFNGRTTFNETFRTKPVAWRKKQLVENVGGLKALASPQRHQFLDLLAQHHKTDFIEMEITPGCSASQMCPLKNAFCVYGEVARQIE